MRPEPSILEAEPNDLEDSTSCHRLKAYLPLFEIALSHSGSEGKTRNGFHHVSSPVRAVLEEILLPLDHPDDVRAGVDPSSPLVRVPQVISDQASVPINMLELAPLAIHRKAEIS